jgi:hypothetical protein
MSDTNKFWDDIRFFYRMRPKLAWSLTGVGIGLFGAIPLIPDVPSYRTTLMAVTGFTSGLYFANFGYIRTTFRNVVRDIEGRSLEATVRKAWTKPYVLEWVKRTGKTEEYRQAIETNAAWDSLESR